MKTLFILMALIVSLASFAEDKQVTNQVVKDNSLASKTAMMNYIPQISNTGYYLNRSANCRIAALFTSIGAGLFIGICESVDFNTDNTRDKVITAGSCFFGVGILALEIADLVYYKKAANAAKVEIRPATQGLGMNISF